MVFNIKQKFKVLKEIINNGFHPYDFINNCINVFCYYQRIYNGFNKLAYIYKLKKAKIQTSQDFFLNELTETDMNVITILHHNNKYLFSITDLVNIWLNALCNSPYFIPTPIEIKNPYDNIPFIKSILYNIYFFIRSKYAIVPPLIQAFFLTNFHLKEFEYKHKQQIQEFSLYRYVYNTPPDSIHTSIVDMIYEHNNTKPKLKIHHEFPKDILLEIMRPYLLLYYKSKYSGTRFLNNKYYMILQQKMMAFIEYNPHFGKKHKFPRNIILSSFVRAHSTFGGIHLFNNNHIKFQNNNVCDITDDFFKSHLSVEDNDDYFDDDDDDDDVDANRGMSY